MKAQTEMSSVDRAGGGPQQPPQRVGDAAPEESELSNIESPEADNSGKSWGTNTSTGTIMPQETATPCWCYKNGNKAAVLPFTRGERGSIVGCSWPREREERKRQKKAERREKGLEQDEMKHRPKETKGVKETLCIVGCLSSSEKEKEKKYNSRKRGGKVASADGTTPVNSTFPNKKTSASECSATVRGEETVGWVLLSTQKAGEREQRQWKFCLVGEIKATRSTLSVK